MRRILSWIIALVALLCTAAWSQTMIEYSGVASSSSTGISKAAGSVANATDALGKRLGDALANTGSADSAASSRKQTSSDGQKPPTRNGAILHITSSPQGAMLFVDHQAIARTPAVVRLPVGKHTLELKLPRYLAWNQEVTATDGEKLSFEPKLQENQQAQQENKQAQSDNRIINLSF